MSSSLAVHLRTDDETRTKTGQPKKGVQWNGKRVLNAQLFFKTEIVARVNHLFQAVVSFAKAPLNLIDLTLCSLWMGKGAVEWLSYKVFAVSYKSEFPRATSIFYLYLHEIRAQLAQALIHAVGVVRPHGAIALNKLTTGKEGQKRALEYVQDVKKRAEKTIIKLTGQKEGIMRSQQKVDAIAEESTQEHDRAQKDYDKRFDFFEGDLFDDEPRRIKLEAAKENLASAKKYQKWIKNLLDENCSDVAEYQRSFVQKQVMLGHLIELRRNKGLLKK